MKEKRKDDRMNKKKNKKEKKSKRRRSSSSSSGSESDEWVEQKQETKSSDIRNQTSSSREDWMSMTGMIATYSRDDIKTDRKDKEKEKRAESYNPGTSVRELNPYWKEGGTGLPSTSEQLRKSNPFKRPENDDDYNYYKRKHDDDKYKKSNSSKDFKKPNDDDYYGKSDRSRTLRGPDTYDQSNRNAGNSKGFQKPSGNDDFYGKSNKRRSSDDDHYSNRSKLYESSNWKIRNEKNSPDHRIDPHEEVRRSPVNIVTESEEKTPKPSEESDLFLNDEKMNKLAAKIVKAEIMGDTDLVNKLKAKLEGARQYRKDNPDAGISTEKPEDIMLMSTSSRGDSRPLTKTSGAGDPRSKGGKRKAETHTAGERMKYFSNDDGHSLSQLFEQEKYGTNYDDEAQLAKITAKHTNPNDDLEDIFTEEISKNVNRGKEDEKNKQRAIKEHVKLEKSLEGCEFCVGSKAMMKHLMASCGSKVYLALPSRKSLTNGHCVITTVQHATCVTGLDEDVWEEVLDFRKALVNFFNSRDEDVVFFETAVRLHKFPHMVINCVPMPRDVGDTAPIYFKKALLECETEWSINKKVVDLKGKSIRKGVPKGLPYFWVDFGMDPGFAHVIEDQQLFPNNFAEEIIGGILDLDHQLWKKPQREQGDQLRRKVSEFVQAWKPFDSVSKSKV